MYVSLHPIRQFPTLIHKMDCTLKTTILLALMVSCPCYEIFVKVIMIIGYVLTQIVLGLGGIFRSWILRLPFGCTEVPLVAWKVVVSTCPESLPLWVTYSENKWG